MTQEAVVLTAFNACCDDEVVTTRVFGGHYHISVQCFSSLLTSDTDRVLMLLNHHVPYTLVSGILNILMDHYVVPVVNEGTL